MRLRQLLSRMLMAWGAISLIGLIAVSAYVGYQFGPGNRVEIDAATAQDVRFVLNWCELADDRIERVRSRLRFYS
ncbi:MAG: hypothetical protein ACRD2A_20635 [Vicinamibacterales bacterium]